MGAGRSIQLSYAARSATLARMMRFAQILCFATVLAGCAPLQIYHKPGVPVAKLRTDTLACEVQALRDAPVAQQTQQNPPVFIPPRKTCDSSGQCIHEGGYWVPGRIYTVDVNQDLRSRVETQCMANRGYAPVSIPACPSGIKSLERTKVLPRLTERSCAIRNDDGSFLIVNQG